MLFHEGNGKIEIWVSWHACLVQTITLSHQATAMAPGVVSLPPPLTLYAHFPLSSWNHLWPLITLRAKSKAVTVAHEAFHDVALLAFLTNFVLPSPAHHFLALVLFWFLEHIKCSYLRSFMLGFWPGTIIPVPYLCLSSSYSSFPFLIKCHFPQKILSWPPNLNK